MIHPLFKWFGSKWSASKRGNYPAPEGDIYEPFAGGAGYSLCHHERKIFLWDTDAHLRVLWPWLINEAKTSDILDIPINVPIGTDIRSLGLNHGQAVLLKSWQRTNSCGDCWTISKWGHLSGQWTANTRARVAHEVHAIKHWEFTDNITDEWEGTRFVDPPYQYNYQYRSSPIDYDRLASDVTRWAKVGKVIVVEAEGQSGELPRWLPFSYSHEQVTSRRKTKNHHHSRELIWTSLSLVDA